jgi:preprotein translocase SecE subunit
MRKVSWPTRQEATQLTIIVIVVMVFMGIFLGLTDVVAGRLLNLTLGI